MHLFGVPERQEAGHMSSGALTVPALPGNLASDRASAFAHSAARAPFCPLSGPAGGEGPVASLDVAAPESTQGRRAARKAGLALPPATPVVPHPGFRSTRSTGTKPARP